MANLSKKLDIWEKQQLITPEQNKKIKKFEEEKRITHIGDSLVNLAFFIISIGIISIIAANWDKIPAYIKIITDFTLFIALTFATINIKNKGNSPKLESFLFFIFLATLATFGLIVQIFQLFPSNGLPFFLCIITAPLMFTTNKTLIPLTWTIWFIITLATKIDFWDTFFLFFRNHEIFVFYILSLSSLFLSYIFNLLDKQIEGKYKSFKLWKKFFEQIFYIIALITILYVSVKSAKMNYIELILGNLLAYSTFISGTYYFYKKQNHKKQNFNIKMIGLCIFISYANMFKDLIYNGIGLIISGLLLLLLIKFIRYITQKISVTKEQIYEK